MTESLLPVLGEWWRSRGQRQGDGASLPPGASSTPYDLSAVPMLSRRFVFEITYSAAAAARVDLRVNWFSDGKTKVSGPFTLTEVALDATQGKTVTTEVTLPASTSPRWLPSIAVPAGSGEVAISSLKVYETPAKPNPVTVWDGAKEVPVAVTVWDGAKEVPASIEFQA